jgi:hypothetical protein
MINLYLCYYFYAIKAYYVKWNHLFSHVGIEPNPTLSFVVTLHDMKNVFQISNLYIV